MKAQIVRTLISAAGLLAALVLFMIPGPTWIRIVLGIAFIVGAAVVAARAFRRLADPETRRRDLEDRLRNNLG